MAGLKSIKACFVEGTQVVVAMPITDAELRTRIDVSEDGPQDEAGKPTDPAGDESNGIHVASLDGLSAIIAVGAGLAGWRVAERRRKRLDEAAEAALMDDLFGEGENDDLDTDNLDDETVSTLAKEIAATGAASSDNAEALDDLCDALFHGDRAAGAPIPAPSASKGHSQTGAALAERPAPAMARARLRVKTSSRKPTSRMAGQLWLAACLCIAAFFSVRFISSVAAPDRSVALPAASSSFDRDAAVALLTTGYANLPLDENQLAHAGGGMPAAPTGYRYVTKNIEDIEAGELVLATDSATGDTTLKPVVQTFIRTSKHLRILDLKTPDGLTQQFETTDEHPFFSISANDWIPAGELKPGDEVVGATGEIQHVAATQRDERPEGVTVYNVEVEEYHSYCVQERGARAPPVLVHNADEKSYRALSVSDVAAIASGQRIMPKGRRRKVEEHVSGDTSDSACISAAKSLAGSERFRSGNGVAVIDVNRVLETGSGVMAHKNVLQAIRTGACEDLLSQPRKF